LVRGRECRWRDERRESGGLIFLRLGVSERVRRGTRARGSRPCGSEAAREEREGRSIGTGGRQPHADARSPLDDARCDLDEPKAQRGELGTA
jgi:hypothetical protein